MLDPTLRKYRDVLLECRIGDQAKEFERLGPGVAELMQFVRLDIDGVACSERVFTVGAGPDPGRILEEAGRN